METAPFPDAPPITGANASRIALAILVTIGKTSGEGEVEQRVADPRLVDRL